MTTNLDDRINSGTCVMVTRYGDSKQSAVDIIWSGLADVDFGDGLQSNVPVALAVDQAGRDMAIARNLAIAFEDGAIVDLAGFATRDWLDYDQDEPPLALQGRINAALNS